MKALKNTDKLLLILSIILFGIGLVMIFSASNIAAFMRYNKSPYEFLLKQGIWLGLGLVGFYFLIQLSTKAYSALSWFLLILMFVLLILVFLIGPMINDARSWINIGSFSFQPSEFVKVIMIIWYAAFFELNRKKLDKTIYNFFPIIISAVISALIVLQPDFGTAGIIMILSFMLYFIMPVNRLVKFKVLTTSVFAVVFVLLLYYVFNTSSFQRQIERFDFMNPCSEEKFYTTGNQVCNSYIAFNNGNVWGKGLGNSTQKYLYLPESHTDFIFAIVVEELGFVVSSGIILLMLGVLARIIVIGKRSVSSRGSIICYGVAIYLFLHIAINLLGIMGLLPLTGVPLPFLSYGGSFTLSVILGLSVVQRVAIETNLSKKSGK
jgi:cell division protein FtsW